MSTSCYIETGIEQEIESIPASGYAPFYFPEGGGLLLFRFTNDSFMQVLSALRNGANLSYGDGASQVIWNFLVNVEYPLEFCAQIIECIETDPDTQQAIIDFVTSDPSINTYITNIGDNNTLTPGETNQNLLKPGVCEYDYVFNQASVTIDLLHTLSEDIFESVEVGTNAIERAELLINILGAGTRALIADTLLQFADVLIENVQEEYAGAYDTALYDELRCELFCEVKESCVMTIDDIYRYYDNKLGLSLPSDLFEALNAVANFYITGDMPGDTVVYAMHMLIIILIKQANDVLGVNFARLALRITSAASTGDNTWETLCEDCSEIPNLRLVSDPGYTDSTVEFEENIDDDTSVYLLTAEEHGGYSLTQAVSVGGINFYIIDVEVVSGTWPNNSLQMGGGSYDPSDVPCFVATNYIGLYRTSAGGAQPVPGNQIRVTISRNPCQEIYLVGRTDGGFAGVTTTITFVEFTATGGSVYDVVSDATTGPVSVGVNTVEADLTTLKSAYLKEAVSLTPGSSITYHYHEQETTVGDNPGLSGTISSKKWSFYGMTTYGQTLRLTFEPLPY